MTDKCQSHVDVIEVIWQDGVTPPLSPGWAGTTVVPGQQFTEIRANTTADRRTPIAWAAAPAMLLVR